MVPCLPLQSCESPVSVKEHPNKKKEIFVDFYSSNYFRAPSFKFTDLKFLKLPIHLNIHFNFHNTRPLLLLLNLKELPKIMLLADETGMTSRSSRPEVVCKKVFLQILQNSQDKTCARFSF